MLHVFFPVCALVAVGLDAVVALPSHQVLRGFDRGPSSNLRRHAHHQAHHREHQDQQRDLYEPHRRRIPKGTDAPTASPAPSKGSPNGGGGSSKTPAPTISVAPSKGSGGGNGGGGNGKSTPLPTLSYPPTHSLAPSPGSTPDSTPESTPDSTPFGTGGDGDGPTPPRTCFDPECPNDALSFCCGEGTFCYTPYDKFDQSNTCENSAETPMCVTPTDLKATEQNCESGQPTPVCGCDGETYRKDKCAFLAGTGVRAGSGCNGGQYLES